MAMIENLSTLTTIPKKHLERLLNKVFLCIGDAVEEIVLKNEKLTEIDIGIGTLVISIYDDMLKYKFIPNNRLDKVVKSTVVEKKNSLTREIDDNLANKIINVYKDML